MGEDLYMQLMKGLKDLESCTNKISLELFIEGSISIIFLAFLLIMNRYNNLLFHTSIELYINIIFLLVFVFAFNTYSINKNSFLLFFGTGYFFVGITGILHMLTYSGMPFLSKTEGLEIAPQLWIASRYIGSFTSLISAILLVKPHKKVNLYILFVTYFCLTTFLISSILLFYIFPSCYIENVGLTKFKVVSEYIITFTFIITASIFLNFRKKLSSGLFIYLECFLLLSTVSEIFFTGYVVISEWTNVVGHIISGTAAYFLYKGIVIEGLKRPYDIVNHNLKVDGNRLKESEKIIYKNEQCYDFIINNSNDAILAICENKFVFANDKISELVGAESVEVILGLEIDNLFPEETKYQSCKCISDTLVGKGHIPYMESKLLKLDGQVIDVEVTNCYFIYRGKPAVMAMFRDISSKKQIKQLENDIIENKKIIDKTTELNKMLTEFFSNISHELKTPLNVILGAIQILSLPTEQALNNSLELRLNKYLKIMKQNCYRLLRLVNNLIDLSKFDSGYFKLNLKNHNIVNIVEDITLSVADYIEHKGIELVFDTDIEEKVMAIDVDKIERIILNLLSNSIKFTDKGGQILVNLWDRGESLLISIKDTGIGIPEDKLNIIFDRFGQVDKTLSRNHEGSGIGLSLVKSIVEMHEGNIEVKSKLGEGSEFIIELPVRRACEEETQDVCLFENKIEKVSIEFSDIYTK